MVSFTQMIISDKVDSYKEQTKRGIPTTTTLLGPFINGMKMEGFYGLKPPCYDSDLVNHESPTCLHGSPWSAQYSQRLMAGDLPNKHTSINTDDNFHRV